MLLGTLGTILLGSLLAGKGTIRAIEGMIRAGNNLSKIKDGAYVINLDEYESISRNLSDSFICEL